MADDPEAAAKRARVLGILDGMQAVASAVYLVLVFVVLGAVGAVVYWLRRNATPDFGTQGEWFYVAVGVVLVLAWGIGQTFSIMRQLRRTTARVVGERAPLDLDTTPGGVSLEWGSGPKKAAGTWTWKFESGPQEIKTIRVDEAQIVMAASAAAAGKDWDEICRVINSSYDSLSSAERMVYR